ncbi:tyrosine-type recombinase/integrase [Chloroflexus aggregans]|uniref:tyrosine-type recombinase/integrase n=1 Tax=Chloroflexus aggregans TaxID=152260 RepID=UPI0000E7629E|nr:tyrosine-type recombinase/integrase [Chloroflexus aggregans]
MDIGFVGVLRSQKPAHRPDLLTRAEVKLVLDAVPDGVNKLIFGLLYGAGLRLIECLRLRVGDVDFAHRQITVRDEKGKPDHLTLLPVSLIGPLQNRLRYARMLHQQDLAAGYGDVYLPPAVQEEYPDITERASLARQWRRQYIFPAAHLSTDPRSGLTRRHRVDESVPQKALRQAALSTGIPKRVNCRALRDAFAAHLLESGYGRPHHPGAPRPQRRGDHDGTLHPRPQPPRPGYPQPAG